MNRFVPSVGFVLAGLGVAASIGEWTGVLTAGGVGNVGGALAALMASLAFAARRHGIEDRRLSVAAGIGSGGLALAAAVALVYPAAVGREVAVGPSLPVAFVLGVLGVGVAYADWLGIERGGFLDRGLAGLRALGIGVAGLLGGTVLAGVVLPLLPIEGRLARGGASTVLFSVGLAVVALAYLRTRGLGLDYVDWRWPDRSGWVTVVGGVVGMYAILLVVGAVATALGLPSTEHGIIDEARSNPTILLVLLPLSWLAIGPGEELLARNVIQKYLYESYSRRAAILVGTTVFAAIHLPAYATGDPAAVFVTLLKLFTISLVLGVVYERTDNVVVAALTHGTYDAIQYLLAYLAFARGPF
ncbi:MAG: lysostaphin resistance A-like protein [Halanaeroarchaeum sp.]